MKKSILFFGLACLFAVHGFSQTVPVNVQKTSGTNVITGSLVVGSGKTISATGSGVVTANALSSTAAITGVVPIANLATGTPTGSKFIRDDGTLQVPSSGTPGGSNTQLQYNNSSAFGGISGVTTNGTAITATAGNLIATSPKFVTGINDTNGNAILNLTATGSAVTQFTVANAATGNGPTLSATGSDSNVDININPKGTGRLKTTLSASASTGLVISNVNTGSAAVTEIQFTNNLGSTYLGLGGGNNSGPTFANFFYMYAPSTAAGLAFFANDVRQQTITSTGVNVVATTASTTTGTGALVVSGGVGIAGKLYVGSDLVPAQTNGIVGTTTNNDANAGSVGQYVHSEVPVGSPVSLSTGTAANITSISLTAGDWEVSGNVNFSASTATVTGTSGGITTTTGTVPTDGTEVYSGVQVTLLSETDSVTLPPKRFSLSGTTTVYLVGQSTFSAGSVAGFGSIKARRVR